MKQLPPPIPPGWYDASVLEIPETWERYAQWARDNYPGTRSGQTIMGNLIYLAACYEVKPCYWQRQVLVA